MTSPVSARSERQDDFLRLNSSVLSHTSAHWRRALLTGAAVLALSAAAPPSAFAQTAAWTGAVSSDWTDGANWSTGSAPVGGPATVISASGVPAVLGLNGPAFGSTISLTIGGANNSVTVQNGSRFNTGSTTSIGSSAGGTAVMTITGAGTLWSSGAGGQVVVGSVANGTLNITDGAVVQAANTVRIANGASSTGTLFIASGGILEAVSIIKNLGNARAIFDNGTLRARQNNANFINTLTVSELILASGGLTVDTNGFAIGAPGFSGTGGLTVTGAGTLTLGDASTYTGDTTINAGSTLALSGAGALASSRIIANGTFDISGLAGAGATINRLEGVGTVTLGGKALTASSIAPGGTSIGTLTLDGDYAGTGATLEIQSSLAGDNATTDRLVITGNSTGSTNVAVTKTGGASAATVNGIKIVEVGGASTGTFTLLGDLGINGQQAVASGAYLYGLFQGTPTLADGDWYLRSLVNPADPGAPLVQPAAPVIEAYVASALQSFNEMDTMQQRLGNRSWLETDAEGRGIWGRIAGRHTVNVPGSSTTGASYTTDTVALQGGVDGVIHQSGIGTIVGSGNLQLGHIAADIGSASGSGTVAGTAFGVGGGLTWYGDTGLYLDAQGKLTWFDTSLHSNTLNRSIVSGNAGFGYALSLEGGQQLALDDNWSITPQAQLSYSHVGFAEFLDPFGNAVTLSRGDSLIGRVGMSADYKADWQDTNGQAGCTHFYGLADVNHEFLDGTSTLIGGDAVNSKNDPLWGGLALGGALNWADDAFSLYGEAGITTSLNNFGKSYGLGATMGFKGKF